MSLKDKAIALLTRREHSIWELKQKLNRRGFLLEEIQPILEDLTKAGWQSDERFCRSYIRARAQKGFGPIRLERELLERGIHKELITTCLAEEAIDWDLLLTQAYRKKYKDKPHTTEEKIKRQRFLLYRGYEMDRIQSLLFY